MVCAPVAPATAAGWPFLKSPLRRAGSRSSMVARLPLWAALGLNQPRGPVLPEAIAQRLMLRFDVSEGELAMRVSEGGPSRLELF